MQQLINALGAPVAGVLNGFDRIVFQGLLRPLMFEEGAMNFFLAEGILFKQAKEWMLRQTARLASTVEDWALAECGEPITYLNSSAIRKEQEARRRQREKGIETGVIGVWSCVEACSSYRLAPGIGAPRLRYARTRCKHLYTYLDHAELGFMSLRIQTWFPYKIQIALNGREWLSRQLAREGLSFERRGNKILYVEDIEAAQRLLDAQVRTDWCSLLDSFVPMAFPTIQSTLGERYNYAWTLWQSEWASDLLFHDRTVLDTTLDSAIRHAFIGAYPGRLLRYFQRPVTRQDRPRRDFRDRLETKILDLDEGCRIRHWLGRNSVKLYNEENVLRIETTINDPRKFRGHRHKQGESEDNPKQLLPLRKGVADIRLRSQASQVVNDRFSDHLSSLQSRDSLETVVLPFTQRKRREQRSVRALDPMGKDRSLLRAIADPRFSVGGFRNKDLRELLAEDPLHQGKTEKQRSGMVTRALRLLREHGVICREAKSRRYHLTRQGQELTSGIQAALAACTEELTRLAA